MIIPYTFLKTQSVDELLQEDWQLGKKLRHQLRMDQAFTHHDEPVPFHELVHQGETVHITLQAQSSYALTHVEHERLYEDEHLHGGFEFIEHIGRGAVQQHFHKHQHADPQLLGVQPGFVAQDELFARQALHAGQHGGGRQGHAFGQFQVGDAAIVLQDGKNAPVDAVQAAVLLKAFIGIAW